MNFDIPGVGRLKARRIKYLEIGASLYFKDPDGLGIELMPRV